MRTCAWSIAGRWQSFDACTNVTQADSRSSWPACEPRWATPRRDRPSLGHEVGVIARKLGLPFMPWQQLVADVGLELLPSGLPAYRTVIVTVPRQMGKTTLILALALHRAIFWPGRRQRIYYSAQTGQDGRQKVIDDWVPILEGSSLMAAVRQVRKGTDQVSIIFRNGSRIDVMASSEHSGHGKTVHLALIDEAFSDVDDRREQAMIPAMKTITDAQEWITSTAGHEGSVFLNRQVDLGRAAVADALDTGIAYFEWSADPEAPIDNPATWYSCMPALGHTITEAVIRYDLAKLPEGEFRRADLNLRTISQERIIPVEVWRAVCDEHLVLDGSISLGVEASPDRSSASIVAVDSMRRAEVIDYREGVTWLLERLPELATRYKAKVAIDAKGPAGSLIPELATAGVRVEQYGNDAVAGATARLYDAIADRQVKVRSIAGDPLDRAVAGARKRISGERWYWSRTSPTVDVSPLVALTLAYDLSVASARKRSPQVFWLPNR